jgi:hypothetical protein
MPISRTYRCPFCSGSFRFLHMTREEPPPSQCQLCEATFEDGPEEQLPLPGIRPSDSSGNAMAQSVAQVQKELERTVYTPSGDVARAGLTNFRDRLKPGDVVARPVNNIVTQVAAEIGQQPWGGASVSSLITSSRSGPAANGTGAISLKAIQKSVLSGGKFA